MGHHFKKLLRCISGKTRLVRKNNQLIPEVELTGPALLPKVIIARYFMDRIQPGGQIIFRSDDIDIPWEMEHMCNRLGHDLMEVGREGKTYFFTLRIRGREDRLPLQDPYRLRLSPQNTIETIDVAPPGRLDGPSGLPAGPRRLLDE